MQESYVRAFTHLDGFRGDSTLATWLSRIVINEALGRLRKTRRAERFVATDDPPDRPRSSRSHSTRALMTRSGQWRKGRY